MINTLQPIIQAQWKVDQTWKIIYGVILMFSQFSAILLPFMYWKSKKCRHYPSLILSIICILEMISTYHLFYWSICLLDVFTFFHIYDLVQYYTFFFIDGDNYINSKICQLNLGIYYFGVFFQLSYYFVLCVDLIITLKRPFVNSKDRIFKYHIFCCIQNLFQLILVFLSIIPFTLIVKDLLRYCKSDKLCDSQYIEIEYNPLAVIQILLLIVALVSVYFGLVDLCRNRKNKSKMIKYKQQYIKNHIFMVIGVAFIWVPVGVYVIISKYFKKSFESNIAQFTLHIIFCLLLSNRKNFYLLITLAIILLLVRIREPYFRFRIKFLLLNLIGKTTDFQKKIVYQIDSEESNQDEWIVPLAELVSRHNNEETVQNILSSILDVMIANNSEITNTDIRAYCQEKKIMTIEKQKSQIKNKKSSNQESLLKSKGIEFNLSYRVAEYSPAIYRYLRRIDNLNIDQIEISLCLNRNEKQIKKTQESLGKSGSFFFFSFDKKLILKTITYSELQTLQSKFLFDYFLHKQRYNSSLLASFYGCYTIDIEGYSSIHLILMENTLEYLSKTNLRVYDLKGSLVNRYVCEKNESRNVKLLNYKNLKRNNIEQSVKKLKKINSSFKVLKDVNFIESNDIFIELNHKTRKQLIKQIKIDSDMLKKKNIMDYSLLLGISHIGQGQISSIIGSHSSSNIYNKENPSNYTRKIVGNKQIVSMGIIDILQRYNILKRLENKYKILISDGKFISCINSYQYQQRFISFMNSIILSIYNYNE